MQDVVEALPELLPPVQAALLDLLALVLAGRTFRRDVAPPHRQLLVQAITSGEALVEAQRSSANPLKSLSSWCRRPTASCWCGPSP